MNKSLIFVLIFSFSNSFSMFNTVGKYYKLFKSVSFFHISMFYNSVRYGSSFTYNQVANDQFASDGIQVEFDELGNIVKLNDGKKTPLIIGTIPKNKDDIFELKNEFNLKEGNQIGIYSLNLKFERNWAGLSDLLSNNSNLKFSKYPTVDFGAPSFVDTLRIVRDIENRDSSSQSIAYVHCKAGRGRSALAIVAYFMSLLHKAKHNVSLEQVEHYLKLKRPQIKLNSDHRAALSEYQKKLTEHSGFENLLGLYKTEIASRDVQVSQDEY